MAGKVVPYKEKEISEEQEAIFLAAWDTATILNLLKTSVANPKIRLDKYRKPLTYPAWLWDIATGKAFSSANPLPVTTYQSVNAKYDSTSGTAAGTTATTATFTQANQVIITPIAIVTAGATTIIVKGTTSGKILATITLPTIAVALTIPSIVYYPSIALAGETVTLVLSANFTSGTVSINVAGN
jgi:hypothetical protein